MRWLLLLLVFAVNAGEAAEELRLGDVCKGTDDAGVEVNRPDDCPRGTKCLDCRHKYKTGCGDDLDRISKCETPPPPEPPHRKLPPCNLTGVNPACKDNPIDEENDSREDICKNPCAMALMACVDNPHFQHGMSKKQMTGIRNIEAMCPQDGTDGKPGDGVCNLDSYRHDEMPRDKNGNPECGWVHCHDAGCGSSPPLRSRNARM